MTRLEELLNIIPDHIDRPILKCEWEEFKPKVRWSECNYPYLLRIDKKDNKFSAYYVFTGFEGEQQILPIYDEEIEQFLEYGGIFERVDTYKLTLEEALEDLLCWLKNINIIKN